MVVTLIWGSTFVVVKEALRDASPLPFLAIRFTLAGLLLLAALGRKGWHRQALVPGAVLGIFLFGGYLFQTLGLQYTSPSKCAFITGFGVILVPAMMVFFGFRLLAATVVGALLGLAGLYFLVLPSGLASVNRGDLLTLAGAVAFALHIVLVASYTRQHSFLHLVPAQIFAVGVLAAAGLPLDPKPAIHWSARLVFAFVVTSVLATGFAFSVQNWAQQFTPPAHTALIFVLEPVFAALTSWVVTGEQLGGKGLAGCGLILAGMVVSGIWGQKITAPIES